MDQTQTDTNLPNATEQAEQEHNTPEVPTPPDNTTESPKPRKKRYEIMKDPLFLSSVVFPPTIPSKPSLSTNRDDHLIPLLSSHTIISFLEHNSLLHICIVVTIHFVVYMTKSKIFFTAIASKIMSPYHYWLENGVKIFSLQFNFLCPSIYDLKTDESDPSFVSVAQKFSHHKTYTKL